MKRRPESLEERTKGKEQYTHIQITNPDYFDEAEELIEQLGGIYYKMKGARILYVSSAVKKILSNRNIPYSKLSKEEYLNRLK